jgi:hypothetical protein
LVGVNDTVVVGEGVGVFGELSVSVLSTPVIVKSEPFGFTTFIDWVSKWMVVETLGEVVLTANGISARRKVSVGGFAFEEGSKARERLMTPDALASLTGVFIIIRLRGEEDVSISPVKLMRAGL